MKKKVMIFGTFDTLHPGHLFFFKEARKHGSLIIVLARDQTVKIVKGVHPHHSEQDRLKILKGLKIADKVVLGEHEDKFSIIEKHKPHVICLGYDQVSFTEGLSEELKKRELEVEIIRLDPYKPDRYKSSKLRGK